MTNTTITEAEIGESLTDIRNYLQQDYSTYGALLSDISTSVSGGDQDIADAIVASQPLNWLYNTTSNDVYSDFVDVASAGLSATLYQAGGQFDLVKDFFNSTNLTAGTYSKTQMMSVTGKNDSWSD